MITRCELNTTSNSKSLRKKCGDEVLAKHITGYPDTISDFIIEHIHTLEIRLFDADYFNKYSLASVFETYPIAFDYIGRLGIKNDVRLFEYDTNGSVKGICQHFGNRPLHSTRYMSIFDVINSRHLFVHKSIITEFIHTIGWDHLWIEYKLTKTEVIYESW